MNFNEEIKQLQAIQAKLDQIEKPTGFQRDALTRVTVALANKMARIAWSVLAREEVYRATFPVSAAG